jgi:hypothetical protein
MGGPAIYTQQNYQIELGDSLNIHYTFHPQMYREELVQRKERSVLCL